MNERTQDFYKPIPEAERAQHVAELREAAKAEAKRSKAVQDFLDEQRRRQAAMLARGPAIPKPVFPKLPDAEEAARMLAEARAVLSAAIAKRDEQRRMVEAAEKAAAAGREAIAYAQAALDACGDVDELVADFRTGQVRAGKAGALPESLTRQRAEQARLQQELNDAQAAARLLAEALKSAQGTLADAQHTVDEHVHAVVEAHLEVVAVEMMEHYRQAVAYRSRIIDFINAGNPPSAPTRQTLHDTAGCGTGQVSADRQRRLQDIRGAIERLQTDAEAILNGNDV